MNRRYSKSSIEEREEEKRNFEINRRIREGKKRN